MDDFLSDQIIDDWESGYERGLSSVAVHTTRKMSECDFIHAVSSLNNDVIVKVRFEFIKFETPKALLIVRKIVHNGTYEQVWIPKSQIISDGDGNSIYSEFNYKYLKVDTWLKERLVWSKVENEDIGIVEMINE